MATVFKSLAFLGYPNYRVSTAGDVESYHPHSRIHSGWKRLKGETFRLKGKPTYMRVGLKDENGMLVRIMVHRLVLLAFVGPRPAGMVACHKDDNGLNNNVDNLRWGTPLSNWEDSVRNGGAATKIGEANCNAVFTNDQVKWMREDMARGLAANPKTSVRSLARKYAEKFKRSFNTVRAILQGHWWKTT